MQILIILQMMDNVIWRTFFYFIKIFICGPLGDLFYFCVNVNLGYGNHGEIIIFI
jgi:hypothetical protein